jgi:hypothetical protein
MFGTAFASDPFGTWGAGMQAHTLVSYDYTALLTRSRWAWEFLRRNSRFREDCERAQSQTVSWKEAGRGITLVKPRQDQRQAQKWGLGFFPDPDENAIAANVFWCSGLYPRAINVHVGPMGPGDVDDIYRRFCELCEIVHFTDLVGREQLLLKTSECVLQVRCSGLSLLSPEPVKMRFVIDGIDDLGGRLKVFEKAKRLFADGRRAQKPKWSRKSLALRNALVAIDCEALGFGHFDIASTIYGRSRAEDQWSSHSDALRQEIYRALKRGRSLRDGGYVELLQRH